VEDALSSADQENDQPESLQNKSSQGAQTRILPPPNNEQKETTAEELPAHKQNAQFMAAMGQSDVNDEDTSGAQPVRISIPTLGVDAPIEAVGLSLQGGDEEEQLLQWAVPAGYAVGWHHTSAPLHAPGNTVLNGHNNMYGAVFRNLVDLELGERFTIYDDGGSYEYEVTRRELFEEDGQSKEERHWNARWMLPTSDERLTIISCWPFKSNTHRIVVIAHPVDDVGT
jgi:LPXTG-site transpeptidase (sortase) family protein